MASIGELKENHSQEGRVKSLWGRPLGARLLNWQLQLGTLHPNPRELQLKILLWPQGLVMAGAVALFFEEGLRGHPARSWESGENSVLLIALPVLVGAKKSLTLLPFVLVSCPDGTFPIHLPRRASSSRDQRQGDGMDPTDMSGGWGPCPPCSLVPSTEPAHSRRSINAH